MRSFINYLVEVNFALCLFYLVYWLLLRTENQFSTKRLYLLASIVFSLGFPLLAMPAPGANLVPTLSSSLPASWLPEIIVTADGTAPRVASTSQAWMWTTRVYMIIAISLLVPVSFSVFKLTRLYRTSSRFIWNGYTVAESHQISGVFSFFNFIFLSRGSGLTKHEKEEVLRHEEIHIQRLHSLDVLLTRLLEIFCWFNPVVWAYRRSLVQLHEFEADARSVQRQDIDRYCGLLARVALQQNGYVLANHFTNSFTLKRISMLKTASKKISQWKVAIALLTGVLIFVVVACQDQIVNEGSAITLTQTEFPSNVQQDIDTKYAAKYPNARFSYLEGAENEIRKQLIDNPQPLQFVLDTYAFPDRGTMGVLTVDVSSTGLKDKDDVFVVVEETAQPKSGIEAYSRYIAANLSYPTEAITRGIEGRVFVEFVVNESGKLSDFRLLRGISPDCDQEAVRVIASGEDWMPGEMGGLPVKQRMVIPIIFKLNPPETSDK